jgi:hypothetical protein
MDWIDLASPNLRCNEGGLDGSKTTVRSAKAGDSFTFYTDVVRSLAKQCL